MISLCHKRSAQEVYPKHLRGQLCGQALILNCSVSLLSWEEFLTVIGDWVV